MKFIRPSVTTNKQSLMTSRDQREFLTVPRRRSTSSDISVFSNLSINEREQPCKGCRELSCLLDKRHSHQSIPECRIHKGYRKLEKCANGGCVSCQLFRKALLLRQTTWDEVTKLTQAFGEVWVSLKDGILNVTVKQPIGHQFTAAVAYTQEGPIEDVRLSSRTNSHGTREEIKKWLRECDKDHDCLNLGWSDTNKNPAKLVHICEETGELEIFSGSEVEDQNYVALSYQWGDELAQSPHERNHIKGVKKLGGEGRLKLSCLPLTLQDAIQIVAKLGLHYIWIDALCIPNDNWNYEASRMHSVYGNAYFTLCLCSSIKTTDGLIFSRKAWEHPSQPCKLNEYWLYNIDMSLDEVRSRARLFQQAWLLQEERLSPRIVYICSQRVYWSCAEHQQMEMGSDTNISRSTHQPSKDSSRQKVWPPPQEFLKTRYNQDLVGLHTQWLELVRDHTRRNIYMASDRFPTMSGLAAQYLLPFLVGNGIHNQEYLSGLWRRTFAHDLAWSVELAGNVEDQLIDVAPTWSWASLPLRTKITVPDNFETCGEEFQILEEPRLGQTNDVLQVAMEGAKIRTVRVMGRLRSLLSKASNAKPWAEIELKSDAEEKFNFKRCRSNFIHSVKFWGGRFIAKEPNKRPVVGQMDYDFPNRQDEAWLKKLYCLEIGASTMLILQRGRKSDQLGTNGERLWCYSRVGIAHGVHQTFFEGVEQHAIVLGEDSNPKQSIRNYDSVKSSTSSHRSHSTLSIGNASKLPSNTILDLARRF